MTDTQNPPSPATGCAPLGRPMAETVSLEVVWAVAFVMARWDNDYHARAAAECADLTVAALLAAHPRGGR